MTGEQLKKARDRLGLTQQDLADKIGITREMIGLMERNLSPVQRRACLAVWCLLYEAGINLPGDRLKFAEGEISM